MNFVIPDNCKYIEFNYLNLIFSIKGYIQLYLVKPINLLRKCNFSWLEYLLKTHIIIIAVVVVANKLHNI